jgi:hypothetical protein
MPPFPPALSDLPSGRRSGLWAWAPSRNLKRDSEDGQANAPPSCSELLSGWLSLFWIVLWAALLASSRVPCSERARANEPEIRQAGMGTRDSG